MVGAAALMPAEAHAAGFADAGGVPLLLVLLILLAVLPLLLWARHRLRQLEAERDRLTQELDECEGELASVPAARYRWASGGSESFEPGLIEGLAGVDGGFRDVLLR